MRLLVFVFSFIFSQVVSAAPLTPREECKADITRLSLKLDQSQGRLLITFTGPQMALAGLTGASGFPNVTTALIPIEAQKGLFIATIQIAGLPLDGARLTKLADGLCSVAAQHGAGYNGTLSFRGNTMTDASMAPIKSPR